MYEYKAKLDRVVVGDTIDVVINLGFKITTHQRIRFAEIQAPEIFSVKKGSEEYKKGVEAKNFVIRRLEENQNEMILKTYKKAGKYGRYIGIIELEDSDISLNDEMIKEGQAVAYK